MSLDKISVVRSSLLDVEVDAIVNAANVMMRGGGGIDGRIHMAAGMKMLWELCKVAPRGCKTGEVVATPGFKLKQPWVIHTPGPVWKGGSKGEPELLANCYRNSMIKAGEIGVKSIGFCSISTGVYGYPLEQAAPIAIEAVVSQIHLVDEVVFAMFGEREFEVFSAELERHRRS